MSRLVKSEVEGKLRIVWGEVYAPNRPDSEGDYMTAEEIRLMAHEFIRTGMTKQVDVEHQNDLTEGVAVVESFIARKGDPDFIEGAWVVGVHVDDDDLWEKVEKGEINGFSMEAIAKKVEREVEVEMPPVVTGLTSKNEDHEHKFYVTYDSEGKFKGGVTDEVDGHKHVIKAGTTTEVTNGHRYRFSSVDSVVVDAEEAED